MINAAAAIAGISESNVIGDFETAWSLIDNGSTNAVFAIGSPSLDAPYYNPNGWTNPDGYTPTSGHTPFARVDNAVCNTPGNDYFINAAGSSGADTFYLAVAFAYYAVNGTYPTGFASLPTPATPSSATLTRGSSNQGCPCSTTSSTSCNSTKTFNDVCGSTSTWVTNSDVICWAKAESNQAQVPTDIILAQWIVEGAHDCNKIPSNCNNPGDANAGTFSRCSPSYTIGTCNSDKTFAGTSTGLEGAIMNGHVFNSGYCEVASAYQNSSLTAGGQELKTYAQNAGWNLSISNGTYNAAYKLGDYSPVWAQSKYTTTNLGSNATPQSDIPGSALIYTIYHEGLEKYDSIG